jgi:hypothetical protein
VTLLFEHNGRRVAIRKLIGYSLPARHSYYFKCLGASWALIMAALLIEMAGYGIDLEVPSFGYGSLLIVGLSFLAIEAGFSAVMLSVVERRRLPSVIKGEF